jgi:hypothetical protein
MEACAVDVERPRKAAMGLYASAGDAIVVRRMDERRVGKQEPVRVYVCLETAAGTDLE